jgi:hypothetical protein
MGAVRMDQGFTRITRATIAALLLMQGLAFAQDVTEPALKAAFIYNFAKFTEWPTAVVPAAEPFVMCVVGDAAFNVVRAEPTRICHLLYVSGMTPGQAAQLVAGLRDLPVLTISDVEDFTELGGIAQFFFTHGQLRFSVQNESAKRARLKISSRLLALAKPQER